MSKYYSEMPLNLKVTAHISSSAKLRYNTNLPIIIIMRFQGICGTVRRHLKKTRTDTQMKFYKAAARPSLLYGSETWVTTKRDMTSLEAAEMAF